MAFWACLAYANPFVAIMARRLENRQLTAVPELLALSQDRARSSGAVAKAKAKPKALRVVWQPIDNAQRSRRERRRRVHKIILWILVRRALLTKLPPELVARICAAWRP